MCLEAEDAMNYEWTCDYERRQALGKSHASSLTRGHWTWAGRGTPPTQAQPPVVVPPF